jgi:hypothetical protein
VCAQNGTEAERLRVLHDVGNLYHVLYEAERLLHVIHKTERL